MADQTKVEIARSGRLPLVGGVLALDFVNTSSGRGGPAFLDHLGTVEDILLWAAHSCAISEAQAGHIRRALKRDSTLRSAMFKEALWLREAIYKVCSALAAARDPARKDLDVLHVALVEYLRSATLTRVDEHYDLAFTGPSHVAVVLGPIAQSAVDLLKGGEFHRLKQCPGPSGDCGWLFYDRTKNNSRRWCEMSVCGNRVKARRYQKRMFVAEEVK